MSRLRRAIGDFSIGAKFAKAASGQEKLDMLDQPAANSLSSVWRIDPNAFRKRNGLRVTALSKWSNRDFREPNRSAVGCFGDEAPSIVVRQK